eukprot:3105430-Prymnesium_polylepis.2
MTPHFHLNKAPRSWEHAPDLKLCSMTDGHCLHPRRGAPGWPASVLRAKSEHSQRHPWRQARQIEVQNDGQAMLEVSSPVAHTPEGNE